MSERFEVDTDGRYIFDTTHDADVKITIDGDWASVDERIAYAQALADRLNGLVED